MHVQNPPRAMQRLLGLKVIVLCYAIDLRTSSKESCIGVYALYNVHVQSPPGAVQRLLGLKVIVVCYAIHVRPAPGNPGLKCMQLYDDPVLNSCHHKA